MIIPVKHSGYQNGIRLYPGGGGGSSAPAPTQGPSAPPPPPDRMASAPTPPTFQQYGSGDNTGSLIRSGAGWRPSQTDYSRPIYGDKNYADNLTGYGQSSQFQQPIYQQQYQDYSQPQNRMNVSQYGQPQGYGGMGGYNQGYGGRGMGGYGGMGGGYNQGYGGRGGFGRGGFGGPQGMMGGYGGGFPQMQNPFSYGGGGGYGGPQMRNPYGQQQGSYGRSDGYDQRAIDAHPQEFQAMLQERDAQFGRMGRNPDPYGMGGRQMETYGGAGPMGGTGEGEIGIGNFMRQQFQPSSNVGPTNAASGSSVSGGISGLLA